MSRRIARQTVLQALFELDTTNGDIQEALETRLEDVELEDRDEQFVRRTVAGVWDNREQLDRAISYFAKDWAVERIARVDRNILRFAIYEIRYVDDVPVKVGINEAIELAKRFGDYNSPKFINGILGAVHDYLETDKPNE